MPDSGRRLEDFFIKLRRSPGAAMTEWATQVRESYRRLQRAMARQRLETTSRSAEFGDVKGGKPRSSHDPSTPVPRRRRSDATSPPERTEANGSVAEERSNPGGLDDQGDFNPDGQGYLHRSMNLKLTLDVGRTGHPKSGRNGMLIGDVVGVQSLHWVQSW